MILEINRKSIVVILIILFVTATEHTFGSAQSIEGRITHASGLSKKEHQNNVREKITFQTLPENFEHNGIRCILRDRKGYMWFGTADGLVRYDGIDLYVYEHDPDDSTSLSNSAINALAEDVKGNLWIGTSIGLNLYNREKDDFIRVGNLHTNLERFNNNYVSDLKLDNNSLLWVATFGDGLSVYDPEKQMIFNYSYTVDHPNTINSNRITSIAIDDENNIWLGSLDGLCFYSAKEKRFRHFYREQGNPRSLSSNNITVIELDPEGNLWVGTRGGGLDKVVKQNNDFIFTRYGNENKPGSLSNNYILSLCADQGGYLWIGTENGGLNRLSLTTGRFDVYKVEEGNRYSIVSNSIWALYYDIEGKLWIGTATKGISVIDEKYSKFESYQKDIFNKASLTDNDVTGFAEDNKGYVWIATDGGGICKFDIEKRQIIKTILHSEESNLLVNNAVQTILCDADDNIWIGTWAGGIDRLTENSKRIRNYKLESEEGRGNNNLLVLFADAKGTIWAGTAGSGLFRYDRIEDRFRQVVCGDQTVILNPSAYVTSMLEDQEGRFWIGTLNGLVTLTFAQDKEPDCFEYNQSENEGELKSRTIDILFEDSRGRLWIGSGDYGLILFNKSDSTFHTINQQDGLPGNSIKGILEDDEGYLWVTTSKGLCRFNYDSASFIIYNRDDGLNSNEFYVRSCLQTKKGLFFLGGENGFNVFYPNEIKTNDFIPPVYLTDLKINNVSAEIGAKNSPLKNHIGETSEIKLNYKQNSFTLEFVALNYTRSLKNQFSYTLEGFEDNWKQAGNTRSATYTNIKPGKYVFRVKGSNNDGIWNNTPASLLITIKPPHWKTWWAILTYIFLISVLITVTLKIWNERIRIKHQLRLEQLGREKEHELNEANIQFFTNISHEFRTPLSLIITPLESIILSAHSKIKEQLIVVYHNAQRLLHLTNNLMDFRKLEEGITSLKVKYGDLVDFVTEASSYFNANSKRHHIHFTIETKETAIHAYFDPEKLETILLNLLSNAFKYTPDNGKIRIELNILTPGDFMKRYDDKTDSTQKDIRYIEIAVIDNGSGIDPEDLPFIFDKFYQSKSQKNKKSSGTGIGLALTKGLTALHHGFIKAISIPNHETRFTLVLPIDHTAYSKDELVSEPANVLKRTILNYPEEYLLQKNTKEQTESDQSEERSDILIVEDNYELRTFLAKELGKEFNITQAEDGKPGIELALEKIPDLIVSDILMPQCNGIDLCKVIKTDRRTCHIPVILLTAKTTVSEQIEGVETGADAYITKPFNMQFLFVQIHQLIQSRRKLYAHFSQDVYILPNKLTDNKMDQDFLQKTIDYIIQNIADNTLNVESLAIALNLSRSNVYRKIKALTGQTIIEFIRIVRLKQAIKLMETKKYSLAEIAYLTGFTSPSYFTKSFKDQYGKPPSEYLT